ncbi:MAG: hypothetical protein ACP5O8_00745 [Candidatus Aenigmatarchaeota archaeon]
MNYSTADYSKILNFVLAKNVYRSRLDKKLIGHAEAKNPEKIIEFGLKQKEFGKIVEKNDQLYLTREEKLGVSLVGKGNVLGNFIFLLEDFTKRLEEFANKLKENERYLN